MNISNSASCGFYVANMYDNNDFTINIYKREYNFCKSEFLGFVLLANDQYLCFSQDDSSSRGPGQQNSTGTDHTTS